MLSVAKITNSAAGGYADYLDAKTHGAEFGDYYLKDGERTEAPGRWCGGADQFGLDPDQAVTGEQLRTLTAVHRLDNGQELRRAGGQRGGGRRDRRDVQCPEVRQCCLGARAAGSPRADRARSRARS